MPRKLILALIPLIAVAGFVLALRGGGAAGKAPVGGAAELEPGVAVQVSASPSRVGVSQLLERLAAASGQGAPAVRRTIAKVEHGMSDHDLAIARQLLSSATWLSLAIDRSCPPPAMLGCHPELRICAHFDEGQGPPGSGLLPATVMAALQAGGFRRLEFRRNTVHSHEETLARWRLDGNTLELTTGWTKLGHCGSGPEGRPPQLRVASSPQELNQIF